MRAHMLVHVGEYGWNGSIQDWLHKTSMRKLRKVPQDESGSLHARRVGAEHQINASFSSGFITLPILFLQTKLD